MPWLDKVVPDRQVSCIYCKCSGNFKNQISYEFNGREFFLFCCPGCSSLIYDPQEILISIPKPYTQEYMDSTRLASKYYLENGYGIDYVVQCALAAIAGCPKAALKEHTFVDVGAGLGLASYFVKNTFDIDVVTIEPSYTGELGKEMLGLDIHNAYFEHLPEHVIDQLRGKPTLLHLNSVIEHLRDPAAVIRELMERTQINAIAAVLPDGKTIDTKIPFNMMAAYLAPGDHLHLPTTDGMAQFYCDLGFEYFAVREMGELMLTIASRFPIELPTQEEVDIAKSALLNRLLEHENIYVARGAAGRLLSAATFTGDETALQGLRQLYAKWFDVEKLKEAIAGSDNWDVIPYDLGSTAFWLGIDLYNQGKLDEGHAWMETSELFADRISRDFPTYATQPLGYKWEARLYRSHFLIMQAEGKLGAAKQCLDSLTGASSDMSGPRPDQVQRAFTAIEKLKLAHNKT